MRAASDDGVDETIRPFDWLTSAVSLRQLLRRTVSELGVVEDDTGRRVLHVGCGSSLTGELMAEDPNVSVVVNVDCDRTTLQRMQDRWAKRCRGESPHNTPTAHRLRQDSMQFVVADFTEHSALVEFDAESFDMVVDKSTLDCMLCTGTGAEGLLLETYRLLKSGGIYLVVTFHHFDFIRPLLEDLPGAEWDITCSTMTRQVEDLTGRGLAGAMTGNISDCHDSTGITINPPPTNANCNGAARTWATGAFQADETYRNTVNVLSCRKRLRGHTNKLDWDEVHAHVSATNNQWYVRDNPMLTLDRAGAIQAAFGNNPLDLPSSYAVLFTDAEREHLDYEDFLEDWKAFQVKYPDDARVSNEGSMTAANAIVFLNAMQ